MNKDLSFSLRKNIIPYYFITNRRKKQGKFFHCTKKAKRTKKGASKTRKDIFFILLTFLVILHKNTVSLLLKQQKENQKNFFFLTYLSKYDIVLMPKKAHARVWYKNLRVILWIDAGFLAPKLSVPDRCGKSLWHKNKKRKVKT